jgi:hypothetical protein
MAWLLLGKSIADAGLSLQIGLLGWWALIRNKKPVYPRMPDAAGFLNQLVLTIAVAVLGHLYYESRQDGVRVNLPCVKIRTK